MLDGGCLCLVSRPDLRRRSMVRPSGLVIRGGGGVEKRVMR
ncbi:Hypothetical protein A7982_01977 [Minicystis rosea]|nr:Hypothetical protein A7982_01977 [Minicystis rosea]